MVDGEELRLSSAVLKALDLTPEDGAEPTAEVVAAACLHKLALENGLAERDDDHFSWVDRSGVPRVALELLMNLSLGHGELANDEAVRDALYDALVSLAADQTALKAIDLSRSTTGDELLEFAQIYWNLEADGRRSQLPIRSGQKLSSGMMARIKAPFADEDLADLDLKNRAARAPGYSSVGGAFYARGARVSMLLARRMTGGKDESDVDGARFRSTTTRRGTEWSIVWGRTVPNPTPTVTQRPAANTRLPAADHQSVVEHSFARVKLARGFEGRDSELRALADFCAGPEERLLVIGDRFSGKSALVSEFFVHADLPDVLRLGYFVPPNHREDARYEAMVRDLFRQAYLLTEGHELSAETSDNPGLLRDKLSGLVSRASEEHRTVVLVIDGIDEDVSDRYGARTMMSVLNSLSSPGLKVILSGWTGRIPEDATDWRRLEVQRTAYVAENLRQMEAELELLFDDDSARGILRYLTFGPGAFGADELAELLDTSVRSIRKVLAGSDSRVFSTIAEPGEDERWAFAHLKFADIARGLFADSPGIVELAETETAVRFEEWATSYRDRGWPRKTADYLLAHYPEFLADRGDLTQICALLFDATYLRAVATRFGPANAIPVLAAQALPLALSAVRDEENTDVLETVAKLVTVRDNYQLDAGTIPLALLEAVGRVSGQAAAQTLAIQVIKRDVDYAPEEVPRHADPFEPLASSDAAIVTTLVRTGLRDMASKHKSAKNSHEVQEAYARALLDQGDREGAIRAANAWQRSIETAVEDDQRAIDAYCERMAAQLVQAGDKGYSLSGGSLSEVALTVMANDDEGLSVHAPSVLIAYENFRSCASCVRLLRDAGNQSGASSLALRLLAAYRTVGQFRGAVAINVAAALVWGGHNTEAWELVDAIPEVLISGVSEAVIQEYPGDLVKEALATVMTIHGRPGIADHPSLNPGAGVLDLVRKAPVLPLIEAFMDIGDRNSASKILDDYIKETEYAQVHAALVVRVGAPDDAFSTIQALGTLQDDSPGLEASTPFSVAWHMSALFALLAREHPDSQTADHAVAEIKSLITDAHPEDRPALLDQLANALIDLDHNDEFDSIVDQLDDPADALLRGVEASALRGDPRTAARYANHPLWQRPSTSVKQRISALSQLAISHEDADDLEQASAAIAHALSLAASPAVVTSTRRREVMGAATGLAFDWERMLRLGLKPGIETIGAAASWLEEPQAQLDALQKATIATAKLWMRSRGIPDPPPEGAIGGAQQLQGPDGGRRMEAIIGGQTPAGWEGWTVAFTALCTATDRAGGDSSFPFQFAFRAALDEQSFDNPGRPSPPVLLGYMLTAIARVGIELEPDEVQRVEAALDQSRQRLRNSLTFTVKRRGSLALWAAAESMSRAAIGQQDEARGLVAQATAVLANSQPADLAAHDRDFGLSWCVKTLTFLGEADEAAPLLGFISGAVAAAQANYSLAKAYLDQGDRTRAMQHASRALSEYVDPAILRQLDPELVPTIAAFEETLARGD